MQVPTLCFDCGGVAEPAYSCHMCGAIVCSKCFNKDRGMCRRCAIKPGPAAGT